VVLRALLLLTLASAGTAGPTLQEMAQVTLGFQGAAACWQLAAALAAVALWQLAAALAAVGPAVGGAPAGVVVCWGRVVARAVQEALPRAAVGEAA